RCQWHSRRGRRCILAISRSSLARPPKPRLSREPVALSHVWVSWGACATLASAPFGASRDRTSGECEQSRLWQRLCSEVAGGVRAMTAIRRILCATDFSPASAPAWEFAKRLALSAKADLFLVHVIPP